MGWNNPPIPWSEHERMLSSRRRPGGPPVGADGGDSPGWSLKRNAYVPPPAEDRVESAVPYAELHAHSNFSFLDGASGPEHLLEEAVRLGLHSLAVTDHDGFYGIARMAEAAEAHRGIGTVFGAELSFDLTAPQNGSADPEGSHLLVLARQEEGYHRLAGALTSAQLAGGEKGRPIYDLDELAERAEGHWAILTGCRKGTVRQALVAGGPREAARELDRLVDRFGHDNVIVELHDHGNPLDSDHNDVLFSMAQEQRLQVIATGNVHYARPEEHRLAAALAAVRARRSLDDLDGWLPASGAAHLRSGDEMARRFARYPGVVEHTVTLADELGFRLRSAKPKLPKQKVPEGHTPMTFLRQLVWEAVPRRYGTISDETRVRIERELEVIEMKDFPGYFLIVWDMVRHARALGILCQGRGSAANSVVCYLLDVTAVDPIKYKLPFERFLSSTREEEPDIDVDFDSERREEVIQYIYDKYGRHNAAQVANVIQYRPKFAVRDMAKALGASPGQQDAWSKQVERHGGLVSSTDHDIPDAVVGLALEVLGTPRHLGIHSGGMVLTDRPVGEVCPIEHGRMDGRTVLQWDKDDCAFMGLVKFDMLGLGILSAIQHCFDLARDHLGEQWELATIPKEEQGVYDQLCRADSVGVFQVESRAQMGMLPRMKPRCLYDLVIEIAMVRPGPIQGGAVHPYIRRKMGIDPITYLHPLAKPVLERTLGIPLFQEQLMQLAMALGDLDADQADLLRRAMGSKRGLEKIESVKADLYRGMAGHGITGDDADDVYKRIQSFANFGFAESHAQSFGLLVYASAWLRLHYPAAFLAALLRSQPMGFYSPATLVADARRHGVEVRRPDILRSDWRPGMETAAVMRSPTGDAACLEHEQPVPSANFDPKAHFDTDDHRRDGAFVVRLGLAEVTGIGEKLAKRIVADREKHGDFADMADLVRRVDLTTTQLESLAAAGAFESFGLGMREALWAAGDAAQNRSEYLEHSTVSVQPPLFSTPSGMEVLSADLWATGISPADHPVHYVRSALTDRGVHSAADLRTTESGRRIEVGGVVTHRQRPATASGITFMNLEDETGLVNVICSVGVWNRYRRVARDAPAIIVRGILERSPEGVTNLLADRLEALPITQRTASRDFR
ncbi:error-prone DNA polymerase [Lacisediminihabitans changchengi]|uniref:Error-prone DNA polymerase n=1 Tax=Lacisediminihabitans changchengi TaxID=2787634 RepID=A0A934SN00_9MICO|nr:error-prone DNA polymerase [Lacisediminihabitans changchengi]MBK4346895.1 error-prone DNA polymerase [Lacisediminihabitans changchengi]MBK4347982.1 error-prone DNA polymerase [Lacisediminihabitans changchengi]